MWQKKIMDWKSFYFSSHKDRRYGILIDPLDLETMAM